MWFEAQANGVRDLAELSHVNVTLSDLKNSQTGRLAMNGDIRVERTNGLAEAKLAGVRALQQQGHVVAMVGDGLNDAPVLAGADVSIAIGEGAAPAQRAADLVLASPSLTRIPAAVSLARRTRQ